MSRARLWRGCLRRKWTKKEVRRAQDLSGAKGARDAKLMEIPRPTWRRVSCRDRSRTPRKNKKTWFFVGSRGCGILNAHEASERDDTKGRKNGRYKSTRGTAQRSHRFGDC